MTPDILSSLGNHLWQSTLFAGAVAALSLALKKNRATVRYRLWLAASIKFLVPFSLLIGLGSSIGWSSDRVEAPAALVTAVEGFSEPFNFESATDQSAIAVPSTERPGSVGSGLPVLVFLVWLGGAGLVALAWFRESRRLRIALDTAAPAEISFPIPVLMTESPIDPGVVGILRPILLLPKGLIDRLTPAQVGALLAHELCHVRRRDNLAAAVHMVVEMAFWCHPLVWWIERQLIDERERACDETVLALGGEPQTYAEGILSVCRFYKESRLMCVSGVAGGNLKIRIEDIMRSRIGQQLNIAKRVALATAALAAFAVPIAVGAIATPSTGASSIGTPSPAGAAQPAAAGRLAPPASVSPATPSVVSRPADARPPEAQVVVQSAPAATSRFEEASIRPCDPDNIPPAPPGARGGGPNSFRMSPGRANALCMTVATLIRTAYGHSPANMEVLMGGRGNDMRLDMTYGLGMEDGLRVRGGPNWVRSDQYTIEAVADAGADAQTMKGPMLLELLQRRFQLKAHIESEQIPAFALTVAKGGLKIKPMEEGGCLRPAPPSTGPFVEPLEDVRRNAGAIRNGGKPDCGVTFADNGPNVVMVGAGVRLGGLPLSFQLNASVIDRTGIQDVFNFVFEYGRDENTPGIVGLQRSNEPSDVPRGPNIFIALEEQLGLKLEPARVPREFIVIDRVERPSPN